MHIGHLNFVYKYDATAFSAKWSFKGNQPGEKITDFPGCEGEGVQHSPAEMKIPGWIEAPKQKCPTQGRGRGGGEIFSKTTHLK